jgi:ABC-type nickel/cobalt efflux system permease component RcnA
MLASEVYQWRRARRTATADGTRDHDDARGHAHDGAADHDHDVAHEHATDHEHAVTHPEADHQHGRGPFRHSHGASAGTRVTRRGLFVLGLAGGLVPSANALLILLATVAAGRPAWGVVLVAAFGLGMAAVMASTGLAIVYAGGLVDRLMVRRPARLAAMVPSVAAVTILGLGLVLTTSALAAAATR